jgi:hypothetical protein
MLAWEVRIPNNPAQFSADFEEAFFSPPSRRGRPRRLTIVVLPNSAARPGEVGRI